MSIVAALYHRTTYDYDRPVALAPQIIRLRPAPHSRTRIVSYAMKVEPAQHFINWQQDPHGNWLARLVFPEETRRFQIEIDLVADLAVVNPFDFFVESYAEAMPFAYPAELQHELLPYLEIEPAGERLEAYLGDDRRARRRTRSTSWSTSISACRRMSPTRSGWSRACRPPDETLALGSGSCRDSAWLLVQILRRLGLAARFVSGYLIQLKHDLKALDGPRGTDDGLHRSACLGRGLPPRRRLDRLRPHLGPAHRRGPHAARRDAAVPIRRADLRGGLASPRSTSPSTCR